MANSVPPMQMQGMHAPGMPLQGSMPSMHPATNGMNGMHAPYAMGNRLGMYTSEAGIHVPSGAHMAQVQHMAQGQQMQHQMHHEQMQMHEHMKMQHMQQQENINYQMYASHGSAPAMHMSHPHPQMPHPHMPHDGYMPPPLYNSQSHMPHDPAQPPQIGLRQSQNNLPIPQQEVDYHMYSSMYEHDALAMRTGIMISADVSPSMAAMNDPTRPPPM